VSRFLIVETTQLTIKTFRFALPQRTRERFSTVPERSPRIARSSKNTTAASGDSGAAAACKQ